MHTEHLLSLSRKIAGDGEQRAHRLATLLGIHVGTARTRTSVDIAATLQVVAAGQSLLLSTEILLLQMQSELAKLFLHPSQLLLMKDNQLVEGVTIGAWIITQSTLPLRLSFRRHVGRVIACLGRQRVVCNGTRTCGHPN